MAGHTSEKRWRSNQTQDSGQGVSETVMGAAQQMTHALDLTNEVYTELLELYQYCGSTAQGLADQLFYEDWSVRESDPIGNPGVLDTQANALEVEKAQAAIDAMTAMNEIYQAANNVAVTQSDRMPAIRRMS
jgi:hypothetical protein